MAALLALLVGVGDAAARANVFRFLGRVAAILRPPPPVVSDLLARALSNLPHVGAVDDGLAEFAMDFAKSVCFCGGKNGKDDRKNGKFYSKNGGKNYQKNDEKHLGKNGRYLLKLSEGMAALRNRSGEVVSEADFEYWAAAFEGGGDGEASQRKRTKVFLMKIAGEDVSELRRRQ